MNNEKDELKECIAREFEEIAKEEEESLEKDTSLVVPEGTKEAVLARLKEQMREYQREQAENEAREREEAINNLSEEDRRALELGRKMLKAEVGTADTSEKKVHYRRKPLKIYLALAAVIGCGKSSKSRRRDCDPCKRNWDGACKEISWGITGGRKRGHSDRN